MRRFKKAFFETPFDLCVLHIYHVTRVATLSVRILVFLLFVSVLKDSMRFGLMTIDHVTCRKPKFE